ncbi:hypothetical protein O3M35_008586 [Rhynocoris fuscipes]|uniref:Uncharacterized protein n=1 Tax=Rhynocoris fuscipes TaxID=488301 RepID=A0AAW1D9I5_9HEMI
MGANIESNNLSNLEINDSDSEEEPCKKRKLEDKNENITNSITINQTDDEEEEDDDIDENDDVIEEVDDEEDDEDEVEEVIDLDSDSVLSKDNKINKQI